MDSDFCGSAASFIYRTFTPMKQTLLILFVLSASLLPLRAQQVFQFELESSARTMRNSHAGFLRMRLAYFQNAALLYLKQQSVANPKEVTPKWLDNQAYHLADFLSLYQHLLTDESLGIQETARIKSLFRDASLAFPYFEDSNSTTLRFVDNPNTDTTPFALDVDWEKAFHSIFDNKNNILYRQQIEEFQRVSKH